jgi:hypothetical protein
MAAKEFPVAMKGCARAKWGNHYCPARQLALSLLRVRRDNSTVRKFTSHKSSRVAQRSRRFYATNFFTGNGSSRSTAAASRCCRVSQTRRSNQNSRLTSCRYIKEADEVERALTESCQQQPNAELRTSSKNRNIKSLQAQKVEIERNIEKTLEPYAQVVCRHLCKKVFERLPRELRDLVYELVVEPDHIYAGPQYLTNPGPPCENARGAHYFDARYVGETMRVEFIQMWYRVSLFYFWDKAKNHEVIERFMTYDRWQVGLKPHENISRVQFNVGGNATDYGSDGPFSNRVSEQSRARLIAPFKTITQFRFPHRVHFFVRIHTLGSLEFGSLGGTELREFLGDIVAALKALRLAGHRFRVQWSEIDNLEFDSKSCALSSDAWYDEIQMVSTEALAF